jgi:uncharacterized protein YxeA
MKRILALVVLVVAVMASASAIAPGSDKKERVPVKTENNSKKVTPSSQKAAEAKSCCAEDKSAAKASEAKSSACTNKEATAKAKSSGKK